MEVRVLQRFAEFAGKNLIRSRNDDLIGVAQGRKISDVESQNRRNLREFRTCADHRVVGAPTGHFVFSSAKQQSLV